MLAVGLGASAEGEENPGEGEGGNLALRYWIGERFLGSFSSFVQCMFAKLILEQSFINEWEKIRGRRSRLLRIGLWPRLWRSWQGEIQSSV